MLHEINSQSRRWQGRGEYAPFPDIQCEGIIVVALIGGIAEIDNGVGGLPRVVSVASRGGRKQHETAEPHL